MHISTVEEFEIDAENAEMQHAVEAARILVTPTAYSPMTRPVIRKKVARKHNLYPIFWIVLYIVSQLVIPFGMGWSLTRSNWMSFKLLAWIEIATLVIGCFVYLYYQKRSVFKILMIILIIMAWGLAGYIFVAAALIIRARA